MTLARLSLGLSALAFAVFGALFLVSPTTLGRIGIWLTLPNAVAEIRAFYGGLELGLAAFFVLALQRPAWFAPALMLQALAFGATAAARIFGILFEGGTTEIMLALAAAEVAGCVVAIVALSRLRRETPTSQHAARA